MCGITRRWKASSRRCKPNGLAARFIEQGTPHEASEAIRRRIAKGCSSLSENRIVSGSLQHQSPREFSRARDSDRGMGITPTHAHRCPLKLSLLLPDLKRRSNHVFETPRNQSAHCGFKKRAQPRQASALLISLDRARAMQGRGDRRGQGARLAMVAPAIKLLLESDRGPIHFPVWNSLLGQMKFAVQ